MATTPNVLSNSRTSRPRIPTPVPLAQTDPERQKIYGDLTAEPAAAPPVMRSPEPLKISASEDEKREFVRSILGKVAYEKEYTLFGRIRVKFASRSIKESERMFEEAAKIDKTEDRNCWLRRFQLFSCLREVMDPEAGNYYDVPKNLLDGEWRENIERFLLNLPAPVYQALMGVSDEFEKHVKELVSAAAKPGFWPTVGQG